MAKILLIEDSEMLQKSFRRVLRDHDLVVVSTGLDALQQLEVGQFDLVISDFDLEGPLNGEDVYLWVQTNRPDLLKRYIFCSANSRSEDICKRDGIPYLEKGDTTPAMIRQTVARTLEAA